MKRCGQLSTDEGGKRGQQGRAKGLEVSVVEKLRLGSPARRGRGAIEM